MYTIVYVVLGNIMSEVIGRIWTMNEIGELIFGVKPT